MAVAAESSEQPEPEENQDVTIGVFHTSVFIAQESGRTLDEDRLPARAAVSAITIGELRWGVRV